MKKIWSLRRQGVLLMTLGLGVVIGRTNNPYTVPVLIFLYIAWLLFYDFAMEGRVKNDVSSNRKKQPDNLHGWNDRRRSF
ncbi:hypothetical protein SAV58_001749 [Enterococcus faecalis]|nr:hypothetical protein [Enterococcus faecalis]EGO8530309.1 hypothetical protein [Enterococcus faecalis]EHB6416422.1 hypothetical protein [Enterococcus faecalis]ELS0404595.1 hypothetical protein [Enterococcus faecalis]ELT9090074.1 hypothetical protein [Enterococcus faecalis]